MWLLVKLKEKWMRGDSCSYWKHVPVDKSFGVSDRTAEETKGADGWVSIITV